MSTTCKILDLLDDKDTKLILFFSKQVNTKGKSMKMKVSDGLLSSQKISLGLDFWWHKGVNPNHACALAYHPTT